MTRLLSKDICHISATLKDYNNELVARTGYTLTQIAAHAVGVDENKICRNAATVAVIPLTCGQGVIGGFSQSVESIVSFMGFRAFVTENPDAGGVAEAVEKGAGVLMMADDNRFVAVNLVTRKVADNSEATGKGFAAALDLMTGGLKDKNVLLLGAGPVGTSAACTLARFGALISVYDINLATGNKLAEQLYLKHGCRVSVETELNSALLKHRIIYDACPAKAFIEKKHVDNETFIAAPGIPIGLNEEAQSLVSRNLIHDPLQIGVATMIFDCLNNNDNLA